ncbi:MAG: hypothetical protein ACYDGX_06155 [Thermoleophilia bacterium]
MSLTSREKKLLGVTTWKIKTNAIHGFGEHHKVYYNAAVITNDGIEIKDYSGPGAPPGFTVNG